MSNLRTKKTDNSFLWEKIDLRLETVNQIEKKTINILEAFSGDGLIWDEVKKQTDKKINILRIDIKNKKGSYLKGDNVKFLPSLDLSKFDIIDLDSYGVPYPQLKILFDMKYKGIIHVTFIQSMFGSLPKRFLYELGFTKEMIDKIPSLFNQNGMGKMKDYLSGKGVRKIKGYFIDRKNYFYFKI